MTPSQMTKGQIDKAVANYRAMLEKHSKDFNSEAVQTVLGQPEFTQEQFDVFRKRVEVISTYIVRKVKVNRTQTPREAINATGRVQYLNDEVVRDMPTGEGEEKEVFLVSFKKTLTPDQLEQEVEKTGFVLADPVTQCALNEQDPSLADSYPNATQWRDKNGKACYALFARWNGKRAVGVDQVGYAWGGDWFFVCFRKSS
jgi:hypothetical protein